MRKPTAALAGVGRYGSIFHTKISRSDHPCSHRNDSIQLVAPARRRRPSIPDQGVAINPTEKIRAGAVLFHGYDTHVRIYHGTFRPR